MYETLSTSWPQNRQICVRINNIVNFLRKFFISVWGLLFLCLIVYVADLSVLGYANYYYAAAAQAGAHSWKAFVFGTSDFPATITIDKPPAALWLPSLAIRFFGLSSWSIIMPQVAMLLASVWLLFHLVQRHCGRCAAWLTGAFFAITPIVFVMFRFNDPEALMVLLIIFMADMIDRAITAQSYRMALRFFAIAGLAAGFAFLTKQCEAWMTLPALVITVLIFFPWSWSKKCIGLGVAGIGLFLGASWWVALVTLLPKSKRPYIGSTLDNNFFELTFGYNGIGRIIGNPWEHFAKKHGFLYLRFNVKPPPGYEFRLAHSQPGPERFFFTSEVSQIGWLLGVALLAIVVLGWLCFAKKSALQISPRVSYHVSHRGQRALYLNWTMTLLIMLIVFSSMKIGYHRYYGMVMAPAIAILVGWFIAELWQHKTQRWVKIMALIACCLIATQYFVAYYCDDNDLCFMRWVCVGLALVAVATIICSCYVPWPALRNCVAGAMLILLFSGPLCYTLSSISVPQVAWMPQAGPKPFLPPIMMDDINRDERLTRLVSERITAQLSSEKSHSYLWLAAAGPDMNASLLQLDSGYSVLPIGGFIGTDNNVPFDVLTRYIAEKKIHYFVIFSDDTASYSPSDKEVVEYIRSNYVRREYSQSPSGKIAYVYDLTQHK